MLRKPYFGGFLILLILVVGLGKLAIHAEAAGSRSVMLVYDSKNIAHHGDLELDRCQRLLTSLGLPVKTVQLDQYQAASLQNGRYRGVITMINWEQSKNRNRAFEHDRRVFDGPKLHIGPRLQADERQELGGKFKTLVHQQLKSHQGRVSQPLSANQPILVRDQQSDSTSSVGWLSSQNHPIKKYSYGVKNGNTGFLPELGSDGLSIALAGQLIAKLFKVTVHNQLPLLTITGITPYTKLEDLSRLVNQLATQGFPFALSIVSVERNTDLKAFHRYTKVLRKAEEAGGVIFLRPSTETGTQRLNEAELRSVFQTELASLSADRVLPVGISAPGYWNRSNRRQRAVLNSASHVLLLPDQPQRLEEIPVEPEPVITNENRFKTGIIGVPLKAIETVSRQNEPKFVQPTALLVPMPANRDGIDRLIQQLHGSNIRWLDPVKNHLKTSIKAGSVLFDYRSGQYFFNREPVTDLDADVETLSNSDSQAEPTTWMNRVIQWQSRALLWLFAGIGLILAGLLVLGWRIYRSKFIHSCDIKER